MRDVVVIESIEDARIAAYRNLRKRGGEGERGTFVAENLKVLRRLLQSDVEICSFFALERYYAEFHEALDAKGVPEMARFIADKSLMNEIVGFALHEGAMALARTPEILRVETAATVLPLPAVCLSGVADAENVGAIVRNAAAFGVQSVIVDGASASPYLRRAVRVSLGGVFALRVYGSDDLERDIGLIRRARPERRVFALETSPEAAPLHTARLNDGETYCLVVGSEARGIPDSHRAACEKTLVISMPDANAAAVNSLNVAAASAVALHHFALARSVFERR
jgi:tRNA G18 (ribose-2'-O)-methylase SpoU